MTTAVPVDLVCPCCGKTFKGSRLLSTNNFGGQKTDFHSLAAGASPLPFAISTCPHCGYTDYSGSWRDAASLRPDIRDRIKAQIALLLGEKLPDTDVRYGFLAQIAEWEGKEARFIADQYLKAAWCATDTDRRDDEVFYREQAIRFFEIALQDEAVPHDERQSLTYLVGELYRRIGQREQANEWFDRVISKARPEDKPIIIQAATQQRSDPKEFFRDFIKK